MEWGNNIMAKKNFLKAFDGLFNKVDTTESRYQEALQKKEEALIELQAELQEKQMMLKDMHKMKLLGDISEATFDEYKADADKLQEKYQEAVKEVQLIKEYATEDVKTVLAELEAVKTDYSKEQNAEINKLRLELLDAKLTYLTKMKEARLKYGAIVTPEHKIEQLKIKLGLKQRHYLSGTHDALFQYSVPNGGYENLLIQRQEVYNALSYGNVPSQLHGIVKDAKEKGILEN